jgi:prepilin-type N-terminal cleavage/methylation domain-containing protein
MLKATVRRGFTLVEVMLSLVMLLMVSGTVYQLLFTTQRLSRSQAERLALQASVRGAVLVLANELRELSSADLLGLGPSTVSYRAMRGFGYTCQALTAGVIRIKRTDFSGNREPQAGRDSALVYAPDPAGSADSGWTSLGITSVSSSGSCPGAAAPALSLTVAGSIPVGGLPAGTPVRIHEAMQLASYRSEGRSWLGMRSLSSAEAIQPLFGPLAESEGVRLDFTDRSGAPTLLPAVVKSITVTVRGVSWAAAGSGSEALAETLTTRVGLRNAVY